jgi:tRNA G18 (ribose-2'-O)-methylase SpoU
MRKLSHDEIAQRRLSTGELAAIERFPISVLLDNIRSLYNVGSIFRTADGARISKLYLCGYTPFPPRREIEKTALGATATVPWEYNKDPMIPLRALRKNRVEICVLEQTDKSVPFTAANDITYPLCLVVGNEITGVSKEIIAFADRAIEIPMYGMKQSLNAAVALGITLFTLVGRYTERTPQ